jgi:colanic acid/amylovoran biosynthesis glycosyltransferase
MPEIVEDEVSGMLIPEADENALATALIRLMDDPDLRKKLGENARKKVEARFDISKNVLHYLEVFGGLTTKSL